MKQAYEEKIRRQNKEAGKYNKSDDRLFVCFAIFGYAVKCIMDYFGLSVYLNPLLGICLTLVFLHMACERQKLSI